MPKFLVTMELTFPESTQVDDEFAAQEQVKHRIGLALADEYYDDGYHVDVDVTRVLVVHDARMAFLRTDIRLTELSRRIVDVLRAYFGVRLVGQLAAVRREDLLRATKGPKSIRNFGPRSLHELDNWMRQHELAYADQ